MRCYLPIACVVLVLGSAVSSTALAERDFSQVPGVVVTHRPAAEGVYIGSPGIAVLEDGTYLTKFDEFGPQSTEKTSAKTHVFRSTDEGKTWEEIALLDGLFWASLFVHRGDVYLLGTTYGGGDAVIRKSTDGGRTWTEPKDKTSGILLDDAKYHCAPVPVVVHNGRIWRGMEDLEGSKAPGFGPQFRAFVMSAPVDADLLRADSWTSTNRVGRDASWLDGQFNGWLEGNAVVTPSGKVVDILRNSVRDLDGTAAIIEISDDGKTATFDPEQGFVEFPGGATKFTIRFDPKTNRYWALTNPRLAPYREISAGGVRNTLALISSPDLRRWDINCVLVHHPDTKTHGFQYVDWLFDGDDIIAASRTAYDDGLGGAHNFHDANFLTFHRVKDFRNLTMDDSVPSPISPSTSKD